jgi:membrane protein
MGSKIEPAEYAVAIQQTEIEMEVTKLPTQHPDIKGNLKEPG